MIFYTDFYIPELSRTFWIARNEKGICYIDLHNNSGIFRKHLKESFEEKIVLSDSSLKTEISQILEYFKGKRKEFSLKVFLKGTSFQIRVWSALAKVRYGETVSYSDLAASAGSKRAVRAAATCCAKNPVPIIIPCHRVTSKDGSIGGFGGGASMKRKMLEIERVFIK